MYSLENDEDVEQIEIMEKGKSKLSAQSYIRTSKAL